MNSTVLLCDDAVWGSRHWLQKRQRQVVADGGCTQNRRVVAARTVYGMTCTGLIVGGSHSEAPANG